MSNDASSQSAEWMTYHMGRLDDHAPRIVLILFLRFVDIDLRRDVGFGAQFAHLPLRASTNRTKISRWDGTQFCSVYMYALIHWIRCFDRVIMVTLTCATIDISSDAEIPSMSKRTLISLEENMGNMYNHSLEPMCSVDIHVHATSFYMYYIRKHRTTSVLNFDRILSDVALQLLPLTVARFRCPRPDSGPVWCAPPRRRACAGWWRRDTPRRALPPAPRSGTPTARTRAPPSSSAR